MSDVAALATQFGPLGLVIAYLMMRDLRDDKIKEKRVEADKALAGALASLTTMIQMMGGKQ